MSLRCLTRIAWALSRKSETASSGFHRRQVVLELAGDPERLAARHDETEQRSRCQELGERPGDCRQELFEVVEDEMSLVLADARRNRSSGVLGGAEVLGDQRNDEGRIADGGERYEDRPAVGLLREESSQLDREARLAGAARADDRERSRIVVEPHRRRLDELPLAAEEVRRRRGKLDGAGSP